MSTQSTHGKVAAPDVGRSRTWGRWTLFALGLLLLILVPFFLFEGFFAELCERLVAAPISPWILGPTLALLLASDVFLPIPSSIVSTAGGALLGAWGGGFTSFLGMTVGALLGYGAGRYGGRRGTARLVGKAELARVERLHQRYGSAVVVLCRAIPVLAEASVVFAGVTRVPVRRFLPPVALANAGISAVYALAGAYAMGEGSFLLALLGAITLPAIGLVVARLAGAARAVSTPETK